MSKKDTTNAEAPEKLDLRSHDVGADRCRELLRVFPEIATEGGKLDFKRLKLALGEAIDVGKERFGQTVHRIAGGALLVCLDRALTLELIRAMAARTPERVVCLDEGFARNDRLQANAVQIFKTTGVTSFRTV